MDSNFDDLMNNNDLTNDNMSIDGMEGWSDEHDGETDSSTFGFDGGGETAYGSSTTYSFEGGETAYGSTTTISFEGGETAYGSSTTFGFEDGGSGSGGGGVETAYGTVAFCDSDN